MADQPRLILPNSGRQYDPSVAQDHTGVQFRTEGRANDKASRRDPKYDPSLFIKAPKWFVCTGCQNDNRFRILTESDPRGDGCSQIVCSCGTRTPVLQLGQPQMSDVVARKLGITVPNTMPGFDLELELAKGD